MGELLKVLAEWLSFFFVDGRYRLVNSEVGATYGDAFIEFASDKLRWRLVRDRSQISLSCRPVHGNLKDWDWFSTDILIRLITGHRVESALLTEEVAKWLHIHLSEIEERFEANRLEQTIRDLKHLERIRAKELFG